MFTDLENKNYNSETQKQEILQLHNTLISLVVTMIPIFVVIVLTAMSVIDPMTAGVLVVVIILVLYIYNLSFHLRLNTKTSSETNAHLNQLHAQLHNQSTTGYRQGLGNTNVCPNGLPVWEHYLRKYGLLYDDLGNQQGIPDDGIKYVVVEYSTPTSNTGISLSEIQVWETTSSTDLSNVNVVDGLTNIASQAAVDVTTGFITENDDNNDLEGNKPDTCPSYNLPDNVYYNNNYRNNGHRRNTISSDHYNSDHDASDHTHSSRNARPIMNMTHQQAHRHQDMHNGILNDHIEDHYLQEGMTSGEVQTLITNNNFSDQYLNVVADASGNSVVNKETVKMGLHTAKNHDQLFAVRLVTPTTLMNATVSLLNGNQEVLYSKKIKDTANVYTFRLSGAGTEASINEAIDNYDSSYTQKSYTVCDIPQNRRQYAVQHRANNPRNNMNCSTETFISTINFKPINPKVSPVSNDLI
jgi:hypothetical protein